MVSSALISYSGVCEAGRRNWLWNSEALEGLRSELERLRPWVGSMSCWARWTMLVKLENMVSNEVQGRMTVLRERRDIWLQPTRQQRLAAVGWLKEPRSAVSLPSGCRDWAVASERERGGGARGAALVEADGEARSRRTEQAGRMLQIRRKMRGCWG